jgi:hypothetical protein
MGPPEGPRAFDYSFDLQVPFLYDASEENLVIDIIAPTGYTPALLDDQSSAQGQTGQLVSQRVSDSEGFFHSSQLILQLTFSPEPSVAFDFNADGIVGIADVDMLVGEIVRGNDSNWFDLTSDDIVDDTDLNQWLSDAAGHNGFGEAYLSGDANLDGSVNAADLNELALRWQSSVARWSGGDFTADGIVDSADLNELALNWRQSIPVADSNAAVPEPSSLLIALAAAGLLVRRRSLC